MLLKFADVSIFHLSYIDAPCRISSEEIEKRIYDPLTNLKVPEGTLSKLTGIHYRRFWDDGYQPSIEAARVVEKAISDSGISRDMIDILINCSVCKDYIEPSVASLIHGNVGLRSDCISYDVSNACLGFLSAIHIVANMIERKQIEYGMIVASEGSQYVIEQTINSLNEKEVNLEFFWKNFPTLTLGSGSFAMILTPFDKIKKHQIRGSVSLSDSRYNKLCVGQRDFMYTDGRSIQKHGVRLLTDAYLGAAREFGFSDSKPCHIIPHQVSRNSVLEGIREMDLDKFNVHTIFKEYGNMGPALVPITLGKLIESNKIKVGERVLLLGAGSGLNAGVMVIDW